LSEKEKTRKELLNRLNRVEGQIRGIKNMIEEEKYCLDILHQIWAARSALSKTGEILMENYIRTCLKDASEDNQGNQAVEELIKAIKALLN
jgi:DNA-binding FrmR family transcriptional regulator